jgi:AraC family transcriptional regulator of adaptative response / DNA-3-methyladenine glycosylase II
MELDTEACYQALAAHDARFDGVFFVGVASTGIYCRPVCPAKTPRRERCAFYRSAAAAERAGYRPCRRCRPELAPGSAPVDAVGRLAAAALGRIEAGALGELSLEELATELGVTGRHLRRAVEREFGVSPVELAQTGRLLFAKRLLTDTNLPVTEVAFASGFSSLRRFNALFRERYRLNPTQLRRERAGPAAPAETLAFEVAYRPPLDWPALLAFLGGRGFDGVEAVDGDRYARTVALGACQGWLAVAPVAGRDALRVEVAASLAPVLLPLTARVKRLFDLAARPEAIAAQLGPLAAARPGLRVPGAFDGFEIGIRAILGQQVSVRAATTLAGRLAAALGEPIATPFPQLARRFPTPEQVAAAEFDALRAVGIPAARAHSLRSLARAVADGGLRLEPGGDVEATIARLRQLPGIGEWTAQYVAMRALAWPDAFPHTDLGIRQALGETAPGRILARAEAWRPWRAYAAMHLWKALETNR